MFNKHASAGLGVEAYMHVHLCQEGLLVRKNIKSLPAQTTYARRERQDSCLCTVMNPNSPSTLYRDIDKWIEWKLQ